MIKHKFKHCSNCRHHERKDNFKMVTGKINSENVNWVKLAEDLLQFYECSDKSSFSLKKVHFWQAELWTCSVMLVQGPPTLQKE